MSPKAKSVLAREHLNRALPAVSAEDDTEAVTWLFAALEAAVVALADRHDVDVPPVHWKKADVATTLFRKGHVQQDFAPLLGLLNRARKRAIYDGDEPDLGSQSLEQVAAEVKAAVVAAEGGAG